MRGAGIIAVLLAATVGPALAGGEQDVSLVSEERLDPVYGQGIARAGAEWIVTGRNVIGRLDTGLDQLGQISPAIPAEWAARGFNHVGDPDVYQEFLYAPLEQPDYEVGQQATARYQIATLEFVDATVVLQHENSFVTIDDAGIAYSMDRFGGDQLLRYDVNTGWTPLEPIQLSRTLERVQGADVADGVVWLSTDDADHGIYRVELASGQVRKVGSTGHLDGEGEGIDATELASGQLHVLTVDAAITPVWLGHFAAGEAEATGTPSGTDGNSADLDSRWPPVLVAGAGLLVLLVVIAIVAVVRQARAAARGPRDGRQE
jgi:hypothetical protein